MSGKKGMIGFMKRSVVIGWMITTAIMALCLTGCGESKAAKEARLLGIKQINEADYSGAIVSFDKALEEADGIVNKFELDILKYRGEAEYNLKDYAAAAHTYGILLDVDGEQPEYLYYRAAASALTGNVDAALEDYNRAAEMNSKADKEVAGDSAALSAIGKAYADSGEYEKAMSFYQSAVDAGNATAGDFNQMGLCMLQAEKYDEAIAYFDKGIALNDENMTKELTYNKGAAYEYNTDFLKALEIFKAYAATYGSTPELEKEIAFLESR